MGRSVLGDGYESSLYAALLSLAPTDTTDGPVLDRFVDALVEQVANEYSGRRPGSELLVFPLGTGIYLFDNTGGEVAERTVLAASRPKSPESVRDVGYQRGFPMRERLNGRLVDRGHFIPHSSGGLNGPNLFVQDRALNRGWSTEGRVYRQLEQAAIVGAPDTVFAVRPIYTDSTDVPARLELIVVADGVVHCEEFVNRYDDVGDREDNDILSSFLRGATTGQIGALGEEAAAAFLTEAEDATVVSMDDAGMPRNGAAHDLDLVVIIEGELVAIEVKSRFHAGNAGRITRAGNLPRPRLRRPWTPEAHRQGSQGWVADRLVPHVDTGDGYEGIEVRVVLVDFVAMLAQQFVVNDAGTRLAPLGPPSDCSDAARRGLRTILEHRGYV